jgi:hypothetical protein
MIGEHSNRVWPAMLFLSVLLMAAPCSAQDRKFGLGVIVGEPTGLSAKLWTSNVTALDFGLGWTLREYTVESHDGYVYQPGRVHFHMDYLWHSWNAIQSTERFPLYYGIGGHFDSGAGYDNTLAVRGVFGLAWMPRRAPIDLFVEVVPSLQLVTSSAVYVDAGLGVRYYF